MDHSKPQYLNLGLADTCLGTSANNKIQISSHKLIGSTTVKPIKEASPSLTVLYILTMALFKTLATSRDSKTLEEKRAITKGKSKPKPSPQRALPLSSPTSSLRTHQCQVLGK